MVISYIIGFDFMYCRFRDYYKFVGDCFFDRELYIDVFCVVWGRFISISIRGSEGLVGEVLLIFFCYVLRV